jgi:hypothetical protein
MTVDLFHLPRIGDCPAGNFLRSSLICEPVKFIMREHCLKPLQSGFVAALLARAVSGLAAVEFPGPPPGNAESAQAGGIFTLKNGVISESWQSADGQLRPLRLSNQLTGKQFDQSGAELFRLALSPPKIQKGARWRCVWKPGAWRRWPRAMVRRGRNWPRFRARNLPACRSWCGSAK